MSAAPLQGLYTIPAGGGFLDDLARGLVAHYPPETLARTRVYLPTRRACRGLTEAFLNLTGGAGLLPRAYPLGDADEDDLAFAGLEPALAEVEAAQDLPPAISPMARAFMLAKLAQAKRKAEAGEDLPLAGALRLAETLGKFLDDLAIEQVEPEAIRAIQPDRFAEHWQAVMRFLEIVLDAWPAMLDEAGRVDASARREALLGAQAALWRERPPTEPVLIAGSTGALKSTQALMRALLAAPAGAVVLPGFVGETETEEVEAILASPAHPQHAMRQALVALDRTGADVAAWPGDFGAARHRRAFVREAMRPAERVGGWRDIDRGLVLAGVRDMLRVDAPDPDTEARVLAVWLREQAENSRAALVTPDRALARRVAAELRRWGIQADESAGRPLRETPVGAFLSLLATAAAPGAGAADMLALMKHPLAAGGMARPRFRRRARALELGVWRNEALQRRARGLGDAARLLAEKGRPTLARFAGGVAQALAPLTDLADGERRPLGAFLEAQIRAAEALAADDREAGADRLWRGDDGAEAASLLGELLDAATASPPIVAAEYPEAFQALIEGAAVRQRGQAGARVAILGVLEARLGGYDAVALGGLDEGVWPRLPPPDPWISRGMRAAAGMSDPERRIGLSAHDFAQLLATPTTLLTRSQRRDGAPTKPSRWLARLDAVLEAAGGPKLDAGAAEYLAFAEALDAVLEPMDIPPPAFAPPLAARPRALSVSNVARLRDDPYSLYVREILKIRPLPALDPDPSPADRGRIVHEAYETFIKDWPEALPADIPAALEAATAAALETFAADPVVAAFWRPAFARAAAWAATAEPKRRETLGVRRVHAEISGEAAIAAPGGPFRVQARADRVDVLTGGAVAIADIKTGAAPSKKDLVEARKPQLPLEAGIARHGGFGDLGPRETQSLAVWRLGGRAGGETVEIDAAAVEKSVETAWEGLHRLIAGFDDAETPYLSEPRVASDYPDMRALARRKTDLGSDRR